jgi:lipoate-protein ligase A
MAPTIRLLPLQSADGPANMAADEALLESAVAGLATLRFYTWNEPTLSLGYFQPASDRFKQHRWAELPWVRRASGGSALIHDHELTYALALPSGLPWQKRGESWICRFHDIVAAALREFDVEAQGLTCGDESKLGPALCFWHHTPGDLIHKNNKIAGSAQRKQRGALLQHGGVLLAQSPYTPGLPGIHELTGIGLSAEELAGVVAREFQRELGWSLVQSEWTAAERNRANLLVESKYAAADWNEKR